METGPYLLRASLYFVTGFQIGGVYSKGPEVASMGDKEHNSEQGNKEEATCLL